MAGAPGSGTPRGSIAIRIAGWPAATGAAAGESSGVHGDIVSGFVPDPASRMGQQAAPAFIAWPQAIAQRRASASESAAARRKTAGAIRRNAARAHERRRTETILFKARVEGTPA